MAWPFRRTDGMEVSIFGTLQPPDRSNGSSDLADVGGLIHAYGAALDLGTSAAGVTSSDWALYDSGGSSDSPSDVAERAWVAAAVSDRSLAHMVVRAAHLLVVAVSSATSFDFAGVGVIPPNGNQAALPMAEVANSRELFVRRNVGTPSPFDVGVEFVAESLLSSPRQRAIVERLTSADAGQSFHWSESESRQVVNYRTEVWNPITAAWTAALLVDLASGVGRTDAAIKVERRPRTDGDGV